MEPKDLARIEKRLADLSGYFLANIYFTNAIVALTATDRQFRNLADNLETIIRELDYSGVDKDPHITDRSEACKFYLQRAIDDIEQTHLPQEE